MEKELTILIPALNEEKTIKIVIQKANKWLETNNVNGEILVADNNSIDRTKQIAKENGARVIEVENKGYGNALREGIKQSKGKYIIMGDADDSYNFLEIDEFYNTKAEGVSFETIVASGENTSKPHAVPTDRKIQEKDIITIDMGCKVNGYCSDMTRTFFVGEILEEVKPIYDLVLKNQVQTMQDFKDGVSTRLLTKMVENDFKLHNYDLIHSLGHGVGLEIHEAPYVGYKIDIPLKENMVVTNEPGIYIPGKFGVRIEDTVQITKFGCVSLTNSDKNYIVI